MMHRLTCPECKQDFSFQDLTNGGVFKPLSCADHLPKPIALVVKPDEDVVTGRPTEVRA